MVEPEAYVDANVFVYWLGNDPSLRQNGVSVENEDGGRGSDKVHDPFTDHL